MKKILIIGMALFSFQVIFAQHHHMPGMPDSSMKQVKKVPAKKPSVKKKIQKSSTSKTIKKPLPKKDNSMPGMNMKAMNDTSSKMEKNMNMADTSKKSMQMEDTDHMNMQMNKPDTVPKYKKDTAMNQHDHNLMDKMDMKTDSSMTIMNDMNHQMSMSHVYSLNLPMERNGSGTAWLPDASPMYGYMFHTPRWMYMLHGNLFLRYNNQDFSNKGSRGDTKFDAPDWVMFMGQRPVGKNGLFHFSTMFSFDALIGGGAGYPLLFQSGEAYKGKPIVDRQHPHDLFSELSVSYSQALSPKADLFVYVGYPGEPALGPVAFMHRPSALDNPDAPLSHHWVDATHITFGLATLGFRYDDWKIEVSSFTGREPDDYRYNLDYARFDSWSGRLSYNPSKNWALQVSHGFIKSPELLHPDEDIHRTTASAIYSFAFSSNSTVNATAVWGMNKSSGQNGENAILIEGQWRKKRLALHSRYEWVQKSTEELALDEAIYGNDTAFPINVFTVGFNYDLLKIGQTRIAGGGQFTFYHEDQKLNSLYGKNPMAFEVYIRVYPGMMRMKMK
jgi:hypothetical protein